MTATAGDKRKRSRKFSSRLLIVRTRFKTAGAARVMKLADNNRALVHLGDSASRRLSHGIVAHRQLVLYTNTVGGGKRAPFVDSRRRKCAADNAPRALVRLVRLVR